jgi:hypothetical protein
MTIHMDSPTVLGWATTPVAAMVPDTVAEDTTRAADASSGHSSTTGER